MSEAARQTRTAAPSQGAACPVCKGWIAAQIRVARLASCPSLRASRRPLTGDTVAALSAEGRPFAGLTEAHLDRLPRARGPDHGARFEARKSRVRGRERRRPLDRPRAVACAATVLGDTGCSPTAAADEGSGLFGIGHRQAGGGHEAQRQRQQNAQVAVAGEQAPRRSPPTARREAKARPADAAPGPSRPAPATRSSRRGP